MELPSTVLRWFFDDDPFAFYTFGLDDNFPIHVDPQLNIPGGNVDIKVVMATPNENDQDIFSFLSTMKVNLSAVKRAGKSTISCGLFNPSRRGIISVNFNFNTGIGNNMLRKSQLL